MRRVAVGILLILGCATVGCGPTAATVNAPYAKVLAAARTAIQPGGFEDLSEQELSPQTATRILMIHPGRFNEEGDRTTILIKRVDDDKTRLEVKATSDEGLGPIRDIVKEQSILSRIKETLELQQHEQNVLDSPSSPQEKKRARSVPPPAPRGEAEENWDKVK